MKAIEREGCRDLQRAYEALLAAYAKLVQEPAKTDIGVALAGAANAFRAMTGRPISQPMGDT